MSKFKRILSRRSSPFWQVVKYGAIGVLSTLIQVTVFYLLAVSLLKCLTADDKIVRLLGLPASDVSDTVRGIRYVLATAVGFVVANVFCWLMNRLYVFRAGKFSACKEFLLFVGVSGSAAGLGTLIGWAMIATFSQTTTLAVCLEVVVSFLFNFFLRKFVIFKG